MLKIVICDDDPNFLNLLEAKIQKYLKIKISLPFKILRFNSTESLIKFNIQQIDIVFLDIQFKSMNGIEAASLLRKLSPHFILIFISNFIEYAPQGYGLDTTRYILKSNIDLFLGEAIDESLYKLGFNRHSLTFRFVGYDANTQIYTDEILFLESRLHEVHFHFVNKKRPAYLYNTLNEIQALLPKDEFLRIHQSYLVNLKFFVDAKNYTAKLINEHELPISQRLFNQVKKQLFLYRGNH